jgi:hypothetical protein
MLAASGQGFLLSHLVGLSLPAGRRVKLMLPKDIGTILYSIDRLTCPGHLGFVQPRLQPIDDTSSP